MPDKIQGLYEKVAPYTHWPNPFNGAVKAVNEMACEHTWQATVAFIGVNAASFFYSNFLPSPVEITRKAVFGQYKCGVYFVPHKQKGLLDVIWADKRAGRVAIEIAAPLTRGLFYWWAAETAIAALQQWSTMIYQSEVCDPTGRECLIANGQASWGGGSGHIEGGPVLYNKIYDPLDRYPFGGAAIDIPGNFNVAAQAFGYIQMASSTLHNARVAMRVNGIDYGSYGLGDLGPASITPWSASFSGNASFTTIQPVLIGENTGDTISPNIMTGTRFTVSMGQEIPGAPAGSLFDYEPQTYRCGKLYQNIYASGLR